jgi:hypothetical protein
MLSLPAIARELKAGALLACLWALAPACEPSAPSGGNINIIARSLSATPATWVRCTLQSPTVLSKPLTIPLLVKGDQASTVFKNLPVADDYLLTGDALGSGNVILAHGAVAAVSIVKGKTTQVIIYLNPVTPPQPSVNSSPLIDAITLPTDAVAPGGQIAVTGTAHDPDPGQTATLAFNWLAACGNIAKVGDVPGSDGNHPSHSLATWTAPQKQGTCQITLRVQDVLGLATSASFVVRVDGAASAAGSATVSTVFNGGPEIVAIGATPTQLSNEGPTSGVLQVIASDPEGDKLGYVWSSDPNSPCTVEFTTPTQVSTGFTATATRPDADHCTFLATVDDGVWPDTGFKKNTITAGLILSMTPPLVTQIAPSFGIAYQSTDTATSGTVVWLGATAFDLEGGTLSYEWSASSGSPPQATTPALLGLSPTFTTAATWTVPDGAENMTSDLVVTVAATSSTSGLQSTSTFTLRPANLP